ncbi:Colicin V production protein [Caldalkalibacillus thermarum TA2.A1]|uniref:Colicin V production protein n=1 Tax=Caldalkalibacillus thermarum (strain TA2.A1) TaxID=986075 RepID=F5L8B7_CALTT|nr:CvpA family protein [Caldalkalibacillus thermarum]EGL82437.1 Colicin V production protein [Caldalkalibacillus thermarum TA2.A1]QZT34994.1 CvpA family protein [Caldalkalibacillus thermarum TA2.A1]GGK11884.1 membrane protein [Caldalkalibacillus thermarum]
MNILDFIIVGLLFTGMVMGYRRGFIMHTARLISFIVAVIVAFRYKGQLDPLLREWLPYPLSQLEGEWIWLAVFNAEGIFYGALAFILLFFATKLVLHVIFRILDGISRLPGLNLANRSLGLLVGALQMAIVVFLMVHVLFFLPWETGKTLLLNSELASWLMKKSPLFSLL